MPEAAVIGAGLVGCLAAYGLAQRGWTVTLYERRPDPRRDAFESDRLRSINLALSARGIVAIESVDKALAERILRQVIPMRGRMVHGRDGSSQSQPYSADGQVRSLGSTDLAFADAINSIDRRELNATLLDESEALGADRLRLCFGHKLVRASFDRRTLVFEVDGESERRSVEADFVIGADGAHSRVRDQLMRHVPLDFSQRYIPEVYIELAIPARTGGAYALDPHHLHIWPRGEHMLIALPNSDGSFTSTLFAPSATLDALDRSAQASEDKSAVYVDWFREHYAEAVAYLGEDQLRRALTSYPRGPLLTIQCSTYNYRDRCVLLGDSANSMVPFYGQGVNCGFESTRILLESLPSPSALTPALLDRFSADRRPSLEAICELALRNHVEMARGVTSPLFLARKRVDAVLGRVLGRDRWQSLYELVTFRPDVSYADALRREKRQAVIVERVVWVALALLGLVLLRLAQALSAVTGRY